MSRSNGGHWSATRSMPAIALILLLGAARDSGDTPAVAHQVPTFQGTVELEVGEADGDDPYVFSSIESIVTDPGGRMIVIDLLSHEVRVFHPDGGFAFRFGGPGEGPGELNHPCCLGFAPDGMLWVGADGHYSTFRLEAAGARFVRRWRRTALGVAAPVTFDATGRVIDVGSLRVADRFVLARFHLDPGGAVDTVLMATPEDQLVGRAQLRDERGGVQNIAQPLGPRWLSAHGPEGAWATAISSEYSITLHNGDGTASQIQGPLLRGPAVGPEERDDAQALLDLVAERIGNRPFGIPERKPPLAALFFDRSGRLWVERTGPEGAESREADVYDEGTLVARYRWPLGVDVGVAPWVTETALYGTTEDELGVQRVARVRFGPQ